jgi:hypothetical protein
MVEGDFKKWFIVKSKEVFVGGLKAKILKWDLLQNTFLDKLIQ